MNGYSEGTATTELLPPENSTCYCILPRPADKALLPWFYVHSLLVLANWRGWTVACVNHGMGDQEIPHLKCNTILDCQEMALGGWQ